MNIEYLQEQWTRARAIAERARPHVARAVAEARAECSTIAAELRRHYARAASSPRARFLIAESRSLAGDARGALGSLRLRPALFAVVGLVLLSRMMTGGGSTAPSQRPFPALAPKIDRAKVDAGLARAERESLAATEQATGELATYLSGCRQNSRAFARWMLSFGGKISYARGRADQAFAFIKQLAQTGTMPATSSLPDGFGAEVRQKYSEMVVNPAITRSVVAQALSSYAAHLRQIEAKLVVDLGADIADEALGGAAVQPFDTTPLLSDVDATLSQAMQAAEADFFVAILRDIVMNRIGDAITDQVGADGWNILANITSDYLVGKELDGLAGAGLNYAGYNPESKATAAIERSVDQLTYATVTRLRQALTEAHTSRSARRAEVLHAALERR